MSGIFWRIVASAFLFITWAGVVLAINVPATLVTGQIAGRQFDNSDQSYVIAEFGMRMFHGVGAIISIIFLVIFTMLWWKPIKGAIAAAGTMALLLLVAAPERASAYYDKTDYTEAYFILPNESAFFIPDVGANKDTQNQFGSEEYLKANKIPAKRFTIPHAKLSGSGAWSDFYVPSGRLIVVDRTPFSREWVAGAHRGSSPKDESFPCQSTEGLDAAVGVAIGASVYEENAAKFLFRFGVKPPQGNRADPQVIFTSVFYGRSLAEVMDGPVRNKIQSLVCDEFTKRTVEKINSELAAIREIIEGKARDYLASVGITLDFFGWADTVTFDKPVQAAINRRYEATQDVQIAATLAPHAATLQALAQAEATRTLAGKWDGKVPASVSLWWLPAGISEFFAKISSSTAPKN